MWESDYKVDGSRRSGSIRARGFRCCRAGTGPFDPCHTGSPPRRYRWSVRFLSSA